MRIHRSPFLTSLLKKSSRRWQSLRIAIAFSLISILHASGAHSQQLIEQIKQPESGKDDVSGGAGGQCLWVAAYADWSEKDGKTNFHLKKLQRSFTYTGEQAVPGCFGKKWKSLCRGSRGQFASERNNSIQRYGYCQIPHENAYRGWDLVRVTLADFLGAPPLELIDTSPANYGRTWWVDTSKHWYMDSQCRYRESLGNSKLCGFAGISVSPISLIFDESASLDSDMTVVDFSLDPNRQGSYSVWKGSDKAPLLVYDPERSGNVANATKLFGNYTFGGRKAELSRVALDSRPQRPLWNNGYEALALLDTDHDGRVAGPELEPLALWFDKNRDAHSDAGEVQPLSSVGIIALYYRNPSGTAGSKDIGLTVGYERLVNGRVVQGRSVDWYGEIFSSKMEAAQALGASL